MTQKALVLEHLLNNDHLTPLQAIGVYGIFRLAARVHELQHVLPHPLTISTELVHDARGKRYARYRLAARHGAKLRIMRGCRSVEVDGETISYDSMFDYVEGRRAA